MRIAICFYGYFQYMDIFMIQSKIKNVISPFQNRGEPELIYFLHSFIRSETIAYLDIFRYMFPLYEMSLQQESLVADEIGDKSVNPEYIMNLFSIHKVSSMWARYHNPFQMVILIRLDLLFTKVLNAMDMDMIFLNHHEDKIFLPQNASIQECFMIGNPVVMKIIGDRFLFPEERTLSDLENYLIRNNITILRTMIVFVRIRSDMSVDRRDLTNCPYINDILTGSTSQIHI